MPYAPKPVRLKGFTFDEITLAQIIRAYGFSSYEGLRPILLDGETATLIESRSDTSRKMVLAADGQLWFLKELPWYLDRAAAEATILIAESVRRSGVAVAPIRLTREGSAIFNCMGSMFTLAPYVSGRRYRHLPTQAFAGGEMLARVHGTMLELMLEPECWLHVVRQQLQACASIQSSSPQALVRFIEGAGHIIDLLEKSQEWCEVESQPITTIHGDYNPWNSVFNINGGVAALVDFDNAGRGPALRDIAEGLLTWTAIAYRRDSTHLADCVPPALDGELALAFVSGYQSINSRPVRWDLVGPAAQVAMLELISLGLIRGDIRVELGDELLKRVRLASEVKL